MIYVMSDIHGCYKEFLKVLELIDFKSEDKLFIVGDIVDRGEEPIPLLLDIMNRENVFPLLGNHDYIAASILKKFCVEVTEENAETHLEKQDLLNIYYWMQDGGENTIKQFKALPYEDKVAVLEYFEEFSLVEEVCVNNKEYVLVHAGLEPFDENKACHEYTLAETLFTSTDVNKVYFEDKILVTGHTPTVLIDESKAGYMIEKNNHIMLDCGCVFGFQLGVYCLDTNEQFYVPKS